ncbi:MAG: hypothetical protein IKC59_04805 [Clostridia bacterium]|nr:hypothetical protein [Clostridia bacterium]
MKNRTRKLLALLLTLVMIVPMFAFPTASAETQEICVTEDFQSHEVGTFDSSKTALRTDLSGGTAQIVEENGNKYFKLTSGQENANLYVKLLSLKSNYFTVSGKMKISDESKQNGAGNNNVMFYANYEARGSYNFQASHDYYRNGILTPVTTAAQTAQTGLFDGVNWYCFEFVRNDTQLYITIWKNGTDKPVVPTATIAMPSSAAATPEIRLADFNNQKNNSDVANTWFETSVCLDDLVFDDTAAWNGVTEDFEDSELVLKTSNENTTVSYEKDADGNTYFQCIMNAGAKYYFWADKLATYNFTVAGDIKMGGENCTPLGGTGGGNSVMYFHHDSNRPSGQELYMIHSGTAYGGINGSNNQYFDNTWQSFEYVRSGKTVSLTVWAKGTKKPSTPTYTMTLTANTDGCYMPQLRLAAFSTTTPTTICLDNLTFVNTTADHIKYAGAQASVETPYDETDTTFAMRFLATIDSTKYADARFNVTATYTDTVDGVTGTYTKTFLTPQKCVAYDSILEYSDQGIQKWDAGDLGGKYLIALNVTDIPKSVGTVTFHVEMYCKNSTGGTVTDSCVVTATVQADNTIKVA